MALLDLFAFPSVNEGLHVIFGAMSSGLPVVSTERSGAADRITEGIEGSIVPAKNVTALLKQYFGTTRTRSIPLRWA